MRWVQKTKRQRGSRQKDPVGTEGHKQHKANHHQEDFVSKVVLEYSSGFSWSSGGRNKTILQEGMRQLGADEPGMEL